MNCRRHGASSKKWKRTNSRALRRLIKKVLKKDEK
jgi:hypothetical protein